MFRLLSVVLVQARNSQTKLFDSRNAKIKLLDRVTLKATVIQTKRYSKIIK